VDNGFVLGGCCRVFAMGCHHQNSGAAATPDTEWCSAWFLFLVRCAEGVYRGSHTVFVRCLCDVAYGVAYGVCTVPCAVSRKVLGPCVARRISQRSECTKPKESQPAHRRYKRTPQAIHPLIVVLKTTRHRGKSPGVSRYSAQAQRAGT
jgi:hypothetical protein